MHAKRHSLGMPIVRILATNINKMLDKAVRRVNIKQWTVSADTNDNIGVMLNGSTVDTSQDIFIAAYEAGQPHVPSSLYQRFTVPLL